MCPQTDTNFTRCPAGTFQPESGQSRCLPCLAPFLCSDAGTRVPEPCPPGFVCGKQGALVPERLCPAGYVCKSNTLAMPGLANESFALPSINPRGTHLLHPLTMRDISSLQPFSCANATFCFNGTSSFEPVTQKLLSIQAPFSDLSHPMPCALGSLCLNSSRVDGVVQCPPGFYCPNGADQIPCPVGHYSPFFGNALPLRCPRGTFSNTTSNSACMPCPRGFICPISGMIEPILCAPGLLCTRLGLSYEEMECPRGFFCNGRRTSAETWSPSTILPHYQHDFRLHVAPEGTADHCKESLETLVERKVFRMLA